MSFSHYLHLFDWDAAPAARSRLGDGLFDTDTDEFIGDDSLFLFGIERPIGSEILSMYRDYSFEGASAWCNALLKYFSEEAGFHDLGVVVDKLGPLTTSSYRVCDLRPAPAVMAVPNIVGPGRSKSILEEVSKADFSVISHEHLQAAVDQINPMSLQRHPYFRSVSDVISYFRFFQLLMQQAVDENLGIVSYFE